MLRLVYIGCAFVALCLLTLLPLRAFAYGTVPGSASNLWQGASGGTTCLLGSATDALRCALSVQHSQPQSNFSACTVNSYSADGNTAFGGCTYTPNGNFLSTTAVRQAGGTGCPSDAVAVGAQCMCRAGYKAVGTACVQYSCDGAAAPGGGLSWTGNVGSMCHQGCVYRANAWGYVPSSNTSTTSADFLRATGAQCEGAGATPSGTPGTGDSAGNSTPPLPCPTGQCPGTINGANVCRPCTSNAPGPSNSASAPGGAASAPPLPNAPPGATSSQQQTSCTNGTCTTTTTWHNAGGGNVGTTTREEDQGTFCQENPASPLCRDSTINGTCDQVTCSGDAVQCAIAREQARRSCQFFEPGGPAVAAGIDAGNGGNRPSGHPALAADAVAITFASTLDQTNRLAGSCPADVALSMMGTSYTLALSKVCAPAQMVGQLVVGFALLAAAFIVFRG